MKRVKQIDIFTELLKLLSKRLKVKMATVVEGNQKAPFSIDTTQRCRGGHYPFPGLLHFTLDTYLILLNVSVNYTVFALQKRQQNRSLFPSEVAYYN